MVKQQAMGTLLRMGMGYLTLDMPNKDFFKLENNIKKVSPNSWAACIKWIPNDVPERDQECLEGFLLKSILPPECGQ